MAEQSDFDDSIRRDERTALQSELVARLHQKGVRIGDDADPSDLADLLSAVEGFERAVEAAGGDLMVDSPDSSEPERPDWVIPHVRDDESVTDYTRRVTTATERIGQAS